MKKLILASLLATLFVTAFSFESKAQKIKLTLSDSYGIPGTDCEVHVTIYVTFYWNGTGVTQVTATPPKFRVDCGEGGIWAKDGEVKELSFNDEDAHLKLLEFHKTGDEVIDKMLDDPKFYQWVKSKLDAQTDLQKN